MYIPHIYILFCGVLIFAIISLTVILLVICFILKLTLCSIYLTQAYNVMHEVPNFRHRVALTYWCTSCPVKSTHVVEQYWDMPDRTCRWQMCRNVCMFTGKQAIKHSWIYIRMSLARIQIFGEELAGYLCRECCIKGLQCSHKQLLN